MPLGSLIKRFAWLAAMVLLLQGKMAAQNEEKIISGVFYPIFHGGVSMPAGDLAKRFGVNGFAGTGVWYQFDNGWLTGFDFDFLFGESVREDSLLANLLTANGFLIGTDGLLYEPLFMERGFILKAGAGRLIPLKGQNERSGLLLTLQAGILQHKIRFQFQEPAKIPQLSKDLAKGYDRLTNGFMINEFIGYQYMASNHLVNFRAGIDMSQGFTRSRRTVNYDTGVADTQARLDLLFGIRVAWMLPFYPKNH